MKRILLIIAPLLTLAGLLAIVITMPVFAAPQDEKSSKALCEGSGGTWDPAKDTCNKAGVKAFPEALGAITDILLFIIGAIGVIVIIVGGIRYATSGGDQAAITAAKNTILYAVVGIVVAFMAYAIVKFITGQL